MSREASISPKSGEARALSSVAEEIPQSSVNSVLNLTVADEEKPLLLSMLSLSSPMSASVAPIDELDDSEKDDLVSKDFLVTKKEDEKDRKKSRSKTDEAQPRKRKDTATSITNFFLNKFTRSDKEDKKVIEEEEDAEVDRPDKLASPTSSEEKWFEMRTITAEDARVLGHEADADLFRYEWEPDTMGEKLVIEPVHADRQGVARFEEQSLIQLLEDFRNGEMHWLGEAHLEAMRTVKERHEEVTNLHLRICELEDENEDKDEEIEKLFEQLERKMTGMHDVLDNVFFYDDKQANVNDDEYFSS